MFLRRAKIAARADRQRSELVLYRSLREEEQEEEEEGLREPGWRSNLRDDAIAR